MVPQATYIQPIYPILRQPIYPILFRFTATLLDLGCPSVSEAPSKYGRRSVDKQGGKHFSTGGPSSLLGALQFLRYPIKSRIRYAFYSLKRPLMS